MASPLDVANGGGSASNHAPAAANQALADQLNDDLIVQQTILASLLDIPSNAGTDRQIAQTKSEIKRLQKRLLAVRRRLQQAGSTPSKSTDVDDHAARSLPRVPTPLSSTSTPSTMSSHTGTSTDHSLSRKRSFGHLDPSRLHLPRIKSRRTSPSSGAASSHTPWCSSDNEFSDDVSVIDLTRDDDEYAERLRKEEERLERNKKTAERDALVARQLQERGYVSPPLNPVPGSSSSSGRRERNAYEAMLSQAVQTPRHVHTVSSQPGPSSAKPASSARSGDWSAHHHPKAESIREGVQPPRRTYHVPGAFEDPVDLDDEEDSQPVLDMGTPVSRSRPQLGSSRVLPGDRNLAHDQFPPYGPLPAMELARRAAIARQSAPSSSHPPSNHPDPVRDPFFTPPGTLPSSSGPYNSYSRPGFVYNGMPGVAPRSWERPIMVGYEPPRPTALPPTAPRPMARRSDDPLAEVIRRSNNYDFETLTDGFGNPFNAQLVNYLTDLVDDPRKTDEEIKELLSNVRPDMDIPVEERGQTPPELRYALYPHQQLALKWMSDMEEGTNKGGILADDMGLGKTISTIALMVSRKASDKIKTNLIIGPVALIKQWEREIHKKLNRESRLRVCLMHGKKYQYSELKNYDVVLTTYGTIAQEWKRYQQHITVRQGGQGYDASADAELHRKCPILHPKSVFYRVILDESQCIKNKDAQASKGASMITATYRWCLTGTPMMNGVIELYALIRFLRVRPYNNFRKFQEAFSSLSTRKHSTEFARSGAMQKLRIVLKAIMLRRMKNSLIDGKPILTLPAKTEASEEVTFSPDEQSFYQDLETKSQVVFNRYLRQGTVGKNYSNILVLLLRLRQACCHPHLNMDVEYAVPGDVPFDDMLELAKTLDPLVVERLKAVEAFECPICYDAVENPTLVLPCGHDTCSECFTSLTENAMQNNIRSGQEEAGGGKCPQCRGPINPKKTITYTAFTQVYMPEKLESRIAEVDDESDDSTSSESDTASEVEDSDDDDDDDDVDAKGNLKGFIVSDDEEDEKTEKPREKPLVDEEEDEDPDNDVPDLAAGLERVKREVKQSSSEDEAKDKKQTKKKKKKKKSKKDKKKSNKGKAKEDDVKPHMLQTLRIEAQKNKEARRKYMHYLKKNWEPSAKVTKVMELLRDIEPTGEKTIIFSQWTSLLDLLEIPIKHELGIRYCRYDGGMSRSQRDEAVYDFIENPLTKVMLVSLRAGNAGLNLTAASRIIICDPFWNPYIEMQAVDRAHRIGQQRPVRVHRVLVKGTVEDRIVELQERKRALVDAALDEGENKNLGRLSLQELRYLFGVSSN
ncbi:hypothetical protein VTK73DRAFT_1814 [Phialemonium thermophilum]|uniref:Uncharacterized protein n=1 Tax=Phialemonium thermophilum TaxID=223376 RepID=A0ABR3X8R7_9PEZI